MTHTHGSEADVDVEVVVIGGGAAGLSAATMLGRSRRSVVVVDAGSPRNAPAEAVHGFLSRDGLSPLELLEIGRTEVERYGGVIMRGTAVAARRTSDAHEPRQGFEVTLDDGRTITARRLLVTTGLTDEPPAIDGLAERWGRDVVHCPYCHGWEIRDQPIGVIGTNGNAVHQALMFRQLSSDVALFLHTAPEPAEEEAMQLAATGIRVVPGTVESLEVSDDQITGVRMADGTVEPCSAVAVTPRLVANSAVLTGLGLQPVPHPAGFGETIPADPTGRTSVPGVWVAGNITDPMAQVVAAAAAGALAGAAINGDLITEDTQQAVRMFSPEFWDERYGSAERIWSGNPNPHLVTTATGLTPGTALDVGSGEGADAIWLAAKGWKVTGMDVSQVALDKAAQHAAEAGVDVTWQQADVMSWDPAPEQYDLVSAQFMHLPRPAREALHRRLAAAVRPGGTLLIVGHHPSDLETKIGRPRHPHLLFTAEEIAAVLDPAEWDIHTSTPSRPGTLPDGEEVTLHDAVLRAVRR